MNANTYDAIVIGSGAGGAACAYRLVRGGLRVVMLEKGTYLPTDGSTLDIKLVVEEGQFLSREAWLDGHGRPLTPEEHFNVGGKTKWYGAALLRMAAREFETDAPYGCSGWPIGLADLEPYYAEAEQLLEVRNFGRELDLSRILKRAASRSSDWRAEPMPLGLANNITAYPIEATHFDGFASARGLKSEAEQSFLSRLAGAQNFTLVTNAEVTALLGLAGSPFTLTAVRVADGREFIAPRIFLAAGALHSPRLLARFSSAARVGTSVPPPELVGRHLKLHLVTAMVSVGTRRVEDLIRKTVILTNELFPHSSAQPLGFDGELISTLIPKLVPRFLARELGRRSYGFFLQTEDASDPRNRVLDASDSRAGLPVLDYDEKRMPTALREHRAFTRALKRALRKAGLLSFTQRIGPTGTAHASGTLSCGHNASVSVVDADGRVHGTHGLYVVDGSILPRISRVNPSLTIYAWGLRIGDLVAQQFAHEQGESPKH
jgi:choline dehydrogenase-like flavoprotein